MANYSETGEEGGGMVEFSFNVEGDHSRTSCALPFHHVILRVRGQTCHNRGGRNCQ